MSSAISIDPKADQDIDDAAAYIAARNLDAGLRFYAGTLPRYWEETASQGVQIAYAPGRSIRVLLTAALF